MTNETPYKLEEVAKYIGFYSRARAISSYLSLSEISGDFNTNPHLREMAVELSGIVKKIIKEVPKEVRDSTGISLHSLGSLATHTLVKTARIG